MTGPKKTGRVTKVAKPVKDARFEPGTLVMVNGREDEGPFRVVSTSQMKGSRTCKGYREDGGKFESLPEQSMSPYPKAVN